MKIDLKKALNSIKSIPSIPPFLQEDDSKRMSKLIEMAESQELKGRKQKEIVSYKNRIFRYKGKDHPVESSKEMAKFCDYFFAHCPKSDKRMHWKPIYEAVLNARSASSVEDREKVRGWVRSLNRWANNNKRNFGKFIQFKDEYVYKLK